MGANEIDSVGFVLMKVELLKFCPGRSTFP